MNTTKFLNLTTAPACSSQNHISMTVPCVPLSFHLDFFFFIYVFIDFGERGKERNIDERETSTVSCTPPTGDRTHNRGTWPDRESAPATSWCIGQHSDQLSHTNWAWTFMYIWAKELNINKYWALVRFVFPQWNGLAILILLNNYSRTEQINRYKVDNGGRFLTVLSSKLLCKGVKQEWTL